MKHVNSLDKSLNKGFNMNGRGTLSLDNIQNVKKAFQSQCKGEWDESGSEFEAVIQIQILSSGTKPDNSWDEYKNENVKASSAIEALLKVYERYGYDDTPLQGNHRWEKSNGKWVFELEKDDNPYHIFITHIIKQK